MFIVEDDARCLVTVFTFQLIREEDLTMSGKHMHHLTDCYCTKKTGKGCLTWVNPG